MIKLHKQLLKKSRVKHKHSRICFSTYYRIVYVAKLKYFSGKDKGQTFLNYIFLNYIFLLDVKLDSD